MGTMWLKEKKNQFIEKLTEAELLYLLPIKPI